jgi:D-alanine-D-alanine ligase
MVRVEMAMAEKMSKIRLGILFGGKSGEHEVSISSATSVIGALDPAEFEVTAIGITKGGRLASDAEVRTMLPINLHDRVIFFAGSETEAIAGCWSGEQDLSRRPEIFFPLLHGPYGEDGTIQGLLEMAGFPYVGCGVLASAVGMDKDVMKRLFAHASLPIVPHRVEPARGLEKRLASVRDEIESQFGYPVFSKPANLGSSVGVYKIHHAGEFEAAVLSSAQFDRKIIIEKGIDARELECAVLGNDCPEASGVGEIIPACEFYDYEAKYNNPTSRVQIPADIDERTAEEVRTLSLRAFRVIDGAGLARVDFFLDRGTGKIWLNEINTMPGFTSISMYPKLWAARRVPFNQLIRRLVDLGFERHHDAPAAWGPNAAPWPTAE